MLNEALVMISLLDCGGTVDARALRRLESRSRLSIVDATAREILRWLGFGRDGKVLAIHSPVRSGCGHPHRRLQSRSEAGT
jgi:hypothetical protein